jgi:hypothetical protein
VSTWWKGPARHSLTLCNHPYFLELGTAGKLLCVFAAGNCSRFLCTFPPQRLVCCSSRTSTPASLSVRPQDILKWMCLKVVMGCPNRRGFQERFKPITLAVIRLKSGMTHITSDSPPAVQCFQYISRVLFALSSSFYCILYSRARDKTK